jgi:hypothetical protein
VGRMFICRVRARDASERIFDPIAAVAIPSGDPNSDYVQRKLSCEHVACVSLGFAIERSVDLTA